MPDNPQIPVGQSPFPDVRDLLKGMPRPVPPQKLSTPHVEAGVVLDPASPPDVDLRPGISRQWSFGWAFDGTNYRRLVCDTAGRLIVSPVDYSGITTIVKDHTFDPLEAVELDFGRVVDHVSLAFSGVLCEVGFGLESGVYQLKRHMGGTVTVWVTLYGFFEVKVRCRYVGFTPIEGTTAGFVRIAGDAL